ncbi:MAG: peptide ABC transporter substrate-binding protein [Gemmatimonas sp.]|uniref:peptide ABC transporter substrate-binding protein n=1 Tax=Gemmatimonas sp. TaxID=1962908 RepID=UPI00391F802F
MMPPASRTSTRRPWPGRAARARTGALAGAFALAGTVACAPAAREPGTVVIASGTDLESANPLVTVHTMARQVQRHMLFVTLVRLDSLLQPIPYFARRWEWDGARRTVTFRLDSTLRWHDGHPTTAADVAFTLNRAADSTLGSPRRGDVRVVEQVRTPDPFTLEVRFTSPQAQLPVVFGELPIVPRHLLDTVPTARWRAHPFSTAPVGNGPFRFESRLPGRQWRFGRNETVPAAMGGPPQLRRLVVAVVDEAATKFAGLVSGELDLAGVSPTMARLVREDPALRLMSPPVLFSTVLAFNTTRAPFNDARVRRAVALGVQRERVVDAAVAGFATPAYSAVPPGLPASSPSAQSVNHARDARAADSLLDAAGWTRPSPGATRRRRGVPLTLTLLTVGSGDMAVEQLLQADLATRGVQLEVRVMELASFLATVRQPDKQFDLVLTGIPGDVALGHLSALFDSQQRGGALDYTGFHRPALDQALAQARTANAAEARAAWHAVDTLLQRDMPVAWLYHARGVQGLSARLEHVEMDLRGELVSVSRWTRRPNK